MEPGRNKVLILAPTGNDGAVLKEVLVEEGITVLECESMKLLCDEIEGETGTAIIAEEALSGDALMLLVETINSQPEWSDFPMIIMAGVGSDPDMTWTILGDGKTLNATVLKRPVLSKTLLTAVHANLRSRNQQYRIAEELRKRKEVEGELRRYANQLAVANRDLESFSYSVSHDLRNPLRTIGGFADLLLEDFGEQLGEVGCDYLRRIDKSVVKMQAIIDDMLSLARIGRQEMKREDVDLSAIVHNHLLELKNAEPERHTEILIQQNVHANADPRLMHLALENLLRNAWKFTSKKKICHIEFGTTISNGQTIYFVRDNGIGFDMKFAQIIFQPFKRVHSDKEFGGTGVGLSIVQRVIEKHGGKVWAEGEVNAGAVFFFTLSK